MSWEEVQPQGSGVFQARNSLKHKFGMWWSCEQAASQEEEEKCVGAGGGGSYIVTR